MKVWAAEFLRGVHFFNHNHLKCEVQAATGTKKRVTDSQLVDKRLALAIGQDRPGLGRPVARGALHLDINSISALSSSQRVGFTRFVTSSQFLSLFSMSNGQAFIQDLTMMGR